MAEPTRSASVLKAPAAPDTPEPSGHRATVRQTELLFAISVLVAVFPFFFAAIRAVARGWRPTADDALVAIRSHDVFSLHPPTVGTWSSASQWAHRIVRLPGPLEEYFLAVPTRLFGMAAGTAIGVAFLHALAIVGFAWLVRRRGGPVLASIAMLFAASLSWSMGSATLFDPWWVHTTVFVFALFMVSAWSVADADLVALLFLALTGSYLLETHASYGLLVPLVSLVALVALWWTARRRHEDVDAWRVFRPRLARWALAAFAILFVCWLPPLYQQATGSPGNLSVLLRVARTSPPSQPSFHGAVNAVGSMVALPPFWLPPSWSSPSFHQNGGGRPLGFALAALLVILVGSAWLARDAVRRRDRMSAHLLLITSVGLAGGVLTAWRSPFYGIVPSYMRWVWPLSLLTWFALLTAFLRRGAVLRARAAPHLALASLVLVAMIAILTVVPADRANASPQWGVSATDQLLQPTLSSLHHRRDLVVVVDASDAGFVVGPAVMAELVARGIPFHLTDNGLIATVGRRADPRRRWTALRVTQSLVAPLGSRLLSRFNGLSPSEDKEFVRLTRRVRASLDANAGVHLTASGRHLAATTPFFRGVWSVIEPIRSNPDELTASKTFAALAANNFPRGPALDVGAVDQRNLRRWATLFGREEDRRVLLYIGPLAPRSQ